ncbi:hypothetical protein Hanom_Chr07g00602611 [Helianthus anomalus]
MRMWRLAVRLEALCWLAVDFMKKRVCQHSLWARLIKPECGM